MTFRKTCAALSVNLALLAPRLAFAAPGEAVVQKLIDLLTGNLAKLIAMLLFALIAFAIMHGERDWDKIRNWLIGSVMLTSIAWFADVAFTKS